MPTQFSFGHASPLPLSAGTGGPSLATQRHRGSYRDGWMSQWIRQRLYEVRLILRWLSPGNSLPGDQHRGQRACQEMGEAEPSDMAGGFCEPVCMGFSVLHSLKP